MRRKWLLLMETKRASDRLFNRSQQRKDGEQLVMSASSTGPSSEPCPSHLEVKCVLVDGEASVWNGITIFRTQQKRSLSLLSPCSLLLLDAPSTCLPFLLLLRHSRHHEEQTRIGEEQSPTRPSIGKAEADEASPPAKNDQNKS